MNILKKIIFAVSVFVIMLLIFEVLLRLMGFSARLPVGRLPRYYLRADAELSYDIQENFSPVSHYVEDVDFKLWGNELGCYDRPYRQEPDPVLLVGDSFAHQYGPFETKWGTQLETYLDRRILKCGVMGYGTKQQVLKAKKIIEKVHRDPSVILVSYYSNDLRDDYLFPRYDVIDGYFADRGSHPNTGKFQQIKWWLHENSVIYKTLRDHAKAYIKKSSDPDLETPIENELEFLGISAGDSGNFDEIWASHLRNIKDIQELSSLHNSKLLFVIVPDKQLVYDYLFTDAQSESIKKYLSYRREIFINYLKAQGVPFVDLLPVFKQYAYATKPEEIQSDRDLFWRTDEHYSPKGERLVSLTVAKYLIENKVMSGQQSMVQEDFKREFGELFK